MDKLFESLRFEKFVKELGIKLSVKIRGEIAIQEVLGIQELLQRTCCRYAETKKKHIRRREATLFICSTVCNGHTQCSEQDDDIKSNL